MRVAARCPDQDRTDPCLQPLLGAADEGFVTNGAVQRGRPVSVSDQLAELTHWM